MWDKIKYLIKLKNSNHEYNNNYLIIQINSENDLATDTT